MKPTQIAVPTGTKPIGYARLILERKLSVLPPHHLSFIARGARQVFREPDQERVVYTPQYDPGEADSAHLEFAIKHDGVNLEVLDAYFRSRAPHLEGELAAFVRSKPTGVFSRRLWFLYEWLTGRRLGLEDMSVGNYRPLLDPDKYVTSGHGDRLRRQRLVDNLLGVREFCPIVRRSEYLDDYEARQLAAEASRLVHDYGEEAIRRAVNYLYTRETRSSFEIEHEVPDDKRTERFMALLRTVPQIAKLDERELVRIQNETVEPRFAESSFRTEQNYVGQTIGLKEKVHYLPPRPDDVRALMQGWLASAARLAESGIDPVVHAAALSFAFVFIHPFLDGNGRMHRLLIHQVLSRRGFTPSGLIFPISAVILRRPGEYDDALESFSKPLMALVDHELDEEGRVTVREDTASLYRFPDLTRMAEALYRWVADTIQTDFRLELDFVVEFQKLHEEIRRIVDLPDRLLRLFVRIAVQNGGRISNTKRSKFEKLTDTEVTALEEIVQRHLPKLSAAADLA